MKALQLRLKKLLVDMINYRGRVLLLCFLAFLLNCETEPQNTTIKDLTLLVYMVADNNLNYVIDDELNEMEEAYHDSVNLIVYIDPAESAVPSHPYIAQIKQDESDAIISPIIRVYQEHDSLSNAAFSAVQEWTLANFPANNYGLILWSHGTGWLPPNNQNSKGGRTFGNDDDIEMDIKTLGQLIDSRFNFLIFDACYMSCIEVCYELKDKIDYIIASQTEILSAGFPYDRVIKNLNTGSKAELIEVCNSFYSHYAEQEDSYKQSATVSLIATERLTELAVSVSNLINTDITPLKTSDISNLQTLTLNEDNQRYYLDFKNIMDFAYPLQSMPEYEAFLNLFSTVVLYFTHTEKLFDNLDLTSANGLNCYLPSNTTPEYLNTYYQELSWAKDSNMMEILNES